LRAVFLRALTAPLYLLVASFLTVAATLGLTTWLFHDFLAQDGLVFYVPFAAGVLLVSLGSDYNIFSVGSIWEAAEHRDLPNALTPSPSLVPTGPSAPPGSPWPPASASSPSSRSHPSKSWPSRWASGCCWRPSWCGRYWCPP
jgi:hypothetical protein